MDEMKTNFAFRRNYTAISIPEIDVHRRVTRENDTMNDSSWRFHSEVSTKRIEKEYVNFLENSLLTIRTLLPGTIK